MQQKVLYYSFFILLAIPFCLQAETDCNPWLAKAISVKGKVDSQHTENYNWHPIKRGDTFCYGDKIRTANHSRATMVFENGTRVTIKQNSTLSFSSPNKNETSWLLDIIKGSTFFRSRQPQRLNIRTPFINAVHQGTEFLVTVNSDQTEITVFDGQVAANNQLGEILINKGQTGIANKKQPPRVQALTIRPEDAVQWTLYYPPIINYQDISSSMDEVLQPSINAFLQGKYIQALTSLDKIPSSQHNANYLTLKASLLLMTGGVDETIKLLDQTLLLEPENSTVIALQSIIAVTKNRQKKALSLAQKAVSVASESATAQIALSYAYQSNFEVESALNATQEAVRLSPNNALAWARLSELQLSTGNRKQALVSAQKAQSLNPNLSRTQTILGFAYLSQIDIDQAKAAFNQAITLDSADPLAHLGLGLAKIRKGSIKEGTHDLETAVSLDPDNAIMRSYLGKAYYELRNDGYAETELKIAKEMDPNDPTPWFYDAIRKQTTNRPVEALHDMQKAIELNDNRGVYRSKLLLDEDAAARSANMARIYQDLDFDRVALKQAWTSLGQDYTNPSAHRFLSDTLQGRPRQRIARASELLQAQLFQPINLMPVQPQLTSENIGIINSTGPGSLSSNEYDSLFTSNGAHIVLNGAVGSNNTLTDSAIVSGVYDQLSLSFGQFHYQTDGFRKNDDYKQNIYNAFAQFAITPDLSVQLEFKQEDVTAGDVPLRFNNFHQKNLRETFDQDTARFGLHYQIDKKQDFIFSSFYIDNKEVDKNKTETTTPGIFNSTNFLTFHDKNIHREQGYQLETQYLFHPKNLNIIAGFGYLSLDIKNNETRRAFLSNSLFSPTPAFSPFNSFSLPTNDKLKYINGYIYSNINIYPELTAILGISYDSYRDDFIKTDQLNPKVGLIWNPTKNLTLRSAAFRTLKRPLTASQTIEPTQIAGFNQFFDDNNGTEVWQYGAGVDYKPFKNIFIGGEITWRETNQPILVNGSIKYRKRDESSHNAYIYVTPFDWMAFSSEYRFDEFRSNHNSGVVDPTDPKSIATHRVPLKINFYSANGLFSNFSGTYINQKVEYISNTGGIDGNQNGFWLFDASLGWRLPKKFGSISVEVRNLFDKNSFKYSSTFDASGPQLSGLSSEREIFFKLNLTY